MSQEKRSSRLFGARISSIFSSNDNHPHLKPSDRGSPQKPVTPLSEGRSSGAVISNAPLSRPPLSNVSSSKDYARFFASPAVYSNSADSDTNQNFQSPSTLQVGTKGASDSKNVKTSEDVQTSSNLYRNSQRPQVRRKPPPQLKNNDLPSVVNNKTVLYPESSQNSQLDDVMGTLDEEIDQMLLDPKSAEVTRPNLSNMSSAEQVSPLDFKSGAAHLTRNGNKYAHLTTAEYSRENSGESRTLTSKSMGTGNIDESFPTREQHLAGPLPESNIFTSEIYPTQSCDRFDSQSFGDGFKPEVNDDSSPYKIDNYIPRSSNESAGHMATRYKSFDSQQFDREDLPSMSYDPLTNTNPYDPIGSGPNTESALSMYESTDTKDQMPSTGVYSVKQNFGLGESNYENATQTGMSPFADSNARMNESPMTNPSVSTSSVKDLPSSGSEYAPSTNSLYQSTRAPSSGRFNSKMCLPYPSNDVSEKKGYPIETPPEPSPTSGAPETYEWNDKVCSFENDDLGALKDDYKQRHHLGPASPTKSIDPFTAIKNPLSSPLRTPGQHSRMHSTSSIYSVGSNRHVNLATLKRSFSLRPGEGEHSKYVDTVRKNAGTAFNEAGPGKWKLPTGIMPIEKRDLISFGTSDYTKGASRTGSRNKSSGVELKHGHLRPRLLAAEVDESGESSSMFGVSTKPVHQKAISPVTSKSSTLSNGVNGFSRTNSLDRAATFASSSTSGDFQSSLGKTTPSRRSSTTSFAESVGSLSDNRRMDIYYQHRGYKVDDEDNNSDTDDFTSRGNDVTSRDSDESTEDKPRLYLANPDSSSD